MTTTSTATSKPTTAAPAPLPAITLTGSDRWVACSSTEFGSHVGGVRHIALPGAVTTVCGCTASHPDVWRGNTTKPRCRDCVTRYATKDEQR